MGFMGLGLIVGVAALGVISARAVVERRQQIGVLRAIGFRRRMVQLELPARVVVHRAHVDRRRHRARARGRLQRDRRLAPHSRAGSTWRFAFRGSRLGVIFLARLRRRDGDDARARASAPRAIYPAEALRYQ